MITEDSVYCIGQITRTHGVKGEVSFSFTSDVWDRVEAEYLVLSIDGILIPFFMDEYRFRSDTTALVKFTDYNSAEAAKELCGAQVYFPHALTPPPSAEDEYTWQFFVGFQVVDKDKGLLGKIDYIDDTTSNVLIHVGDVLIPAVKEFIVECDYTGRVMVVDLPSDLLTLNEQE